MMDSSHSSESSEGFRPEEVVKSKKIKIAENLAVLIFKEQRAKKKLIGVRSEIQKAFKVLE